MFHLAFGDQILHGAGDILDRHIGVDAMLIIEINRIDAQSLERPFRHAPDVLRRAVERAARYRVLEFETELRRDDNLITERFECFTNQILVRKRPVHLRGVEKRDAAFDGRPHQRNALVAIGGRSESKTHAHAAKAEGGHFEIAAAKGALLHCSSGFAQPRTAEGTACMAASLTSCACPVMGRNQTCSQARST